MRYLKLITHNEPDFLLYRPHTFRTDKFIVFKDKALVLSQPAAGQADRTRIILITDTAPIHLT